MKYPLAFFLPALVGCGVIFYAIMRYKYIRSPRFWQKLEARVLRSRVVKFVDGEYEFEPRYRAEFLYEYTLHGEQKCSHELSLDRHAFIFITHQAAQNFVNSIVLNTPMQIPVSPDGKVILFDDIDQFRKRHYWAIALLGVVCILPNLSMMII